MVRTYVSTRWTPDEFALKAHDALLQFEEQFPDEDPGSLMVNRNDCPVECWPPSTMWGIPVKFGRAIPRGQCFAFAAKPMFPPLHWKAT